MTITYHCLKLLTHDSIEIINLTPQVNALIQARSMQQGHVLISSRHTTTAVTVNEYEERLLDDIKTYLRKLAPEGDRYLHNDLHLRDVPEDEPENAHSHLMAMTLGNSEMIPVVDGQLALGTYQSILLVELDGPRDRTVGVQLAGQ
jgi:secondary thiamine-phosphate synthase enzyme